MAQEQDVQFVEYIVKAIVENPDKVKVERKIDERGVLIELTVDPADMGKIIGKEGKTAKSVRTLLRVLGAKSDSRINMKIVEPEGGTGGNSEAPHDETAHQAEEADGEMQVEVVPEAEPEEVVPEESETTKAAKAAAKEATEAADLEI